MKSFLKTATLSVLAATAVVATTAPGASAYIACNRFHQCWHTRAQYAYPGAVGIAVYPDTWRWSGAGWRWAGDRAGRGYWDHGRWRRF
jgi:hypothetical protein